MKAPSGLTAQPSHPSGMPVQGEAGFSAARIPDFERLIKGCRDNPGAIRTHRTAMHPSGMPVQGEARFSGARIPDFERLIPGCRDNAGPIRTHRTAIHPSGMPLQGTNQGRVRQIRQSMPQPHRGREAFS